MGVKVRPTKQKSTFDSYVVGIGASAGGLEAINDFFDNTPADTGFAFVLVQHLSPDYKSLMPELLAKHTSMKVFEAQDGMVIKKDCVYLLPSKKFLTLEGGTIHLHNKVSKNVPNNAIDVFFESLASACGPNAVGVVLSGTGTDGTKGLESLKKQGGIVVVQDPITASFDGMPNSAIGAGVADLILAPDVIMNELVEYLKESKGLKTFQLNNYKDELALREILLLIRRDTGHDFSHYKRPTLFRRLSKRLLELNINRIKDYLDYLQKHPDEIKLIGQEFLINVTYFFRDQPAFDLLQTDVISSIFKDKLPGDIVKVWSVACSSGEEAYSVAILCKEYIERKKLFDVTLKIFATDIDRDALDKASKGIYPKSALRDVNESRIFKYFTPEGDNYRIVPDIRKLIVFSYHDVLKDPPFSRMDLVLCRNMLIYIGSDAQKEVIRKIHFALNLDGFLMLGPSEHIGTSGASMEELNKKWRLYKNVSKAKFGEKDQLFSPLDRGTLTGLHQQKIKNPLNFVPELFRDTLLEEYKFAGIYIDPNFEVKQATGAYKNYIDLPDNGFNFNLIRLVPQELGIALNVAIRRAVKERQTITAKRVKVGTGSTQRLVNFIVKPYLQQREYQDQFLFIVLSDDPKSDGGKTKNESLPTMDLDQMASMESELKETRENLQAVIEEVEAANEELQSTNEEMVSTNEELQSTNEELQSLNEELHTVSAEHQLKIKELVELNDDLKNFFKNSHIGQILIDHNLVIRRFSPAVTQMINLIDSDVNRSIMDITTRFADFDLIGDVRQVMKSETPLEKEVRLGKVTYLLKITPYVKQDNTTDGVVVSFVNVTEIKKLNNILHAVLDSSPSSISALRPITDKKGTIIDFEFFASNAEHAGLLGLDAEKIVGRRISEFESEKGNIDHYAAVMKDASKSRREERYDERHDRWFDVVEARLMDGIVIISTDVTERKKAADVIARSFEDLKSTSKKLKNTNLRLEQSNMDLLQFASVASHDLKEPLRKIQTFGNLLMSKAKSKLDTGEQNYLDKIISASGRMQRLIEDVLTLSKLSNRTQEFEEVDLNQVLQMIKDDLEITVKEKGAKIMVGKLPVIHGIGGQMHQVFQNLISNALKFTNGERPEIEITYRELSRNEARDMKLRPGNYHCVTVSDNGIGFEEVYKDKIFGIFQRLNGSEYDGTGIGLAICKKIMENHNGYIIAESKPNKGSEFNIIIPQKQVLQPEPQSYN